MSCRSELDRLAYVDGELPADQVAAFEAHLAACPHCSQDVAALRIEGRLIANALREPEALAAPEREACIPAVAWGMLALAITAVGANTGLDYLAQINAQIGWLSPFSLRRAILIVSSLTTLLAREDVPMLFTPMVALAMSLFVGAALTILVRRRPAVLLGLLLLSAAAVPVSATELRRTVQGQDKILVVPAGEIIDDTVVATGGQVVVDGTITGNLFAFGQQVLVRGEVRGSLYAFAAVVSVDGVVKGDVYSAGQTFDARGTIERNLHAVAVSSVDLASGSRVGNDVWLGAEFARLGGTIGRDLDVRGDVLTLSGTTERAVHFHGHRLSFAETARVGGAIDALISNAGFVSRAPSARLASEPKITQAPHGLAASVERWLTPSFYFWQAARIVAALALGLLLRWLLPALFAFPRLRDLRLLRTGGVGFLALVATPAAAVLLGITVIGLPISVMALGVWFAGMYLAGIFLAVTLGEHLLTSPRSDGRAFAAALAVGLVLIRFAVNIPYLGWVIESLVVIVGFGLFYTQVVRIVGVLRGVPQHGASLAVSR